MMRPPKARVVWSGGGVRVCLRGDAVLVQAVDLSAAPPAWGAADPLLALSALSLAVVALASGPPSGARRAASRRVSPGLAVYLYLERKAMVADEVLAQALRSVMGHVRTEHLSSNDRGRLRARGAVGSPAEPVSGREDGNNTKA